MKSIMMTYAGFHDLPKGTKKMLLASETFFFEEARIPTQRPVRHAPGNSQKAAMEIERRFSFPPYFPESPDSWTHLMLAETPATASAVRPNSQLFR